MSNGLDVERCLKFIEMYNELRVFSIVASRTNVLQTALAMIAIYKYYGPLTKRLLGYCA